VTSGVYRYKGRFLLHAPIERGRRARDDDHRHVADRRAHLHAHAGGDNLDGMAFYLVHARFDFEVLDPPEPGRAPAKSPSG